MGRGKFFTTTELEEIKSFVKDGVSYPEIAELMGRTEKSIVNAVWRYRLKEDTSVSSEETLFPTASSTAEQEQPEEQVVETPVAETAVASEAPKVVYIEKTLNDFPPRELISNLYERGYRIRKDGKLICIVEQVVNLNDIINGKNNPNLR